MESNRERERKNKDEKTRTIDFQSSAREINLKH